MIDSSSLYFKTLCEWLDLPIFPVTNRDGSNAIRNLSNTLFVPDNELLKPRFDGKVDMLDFGENHIWDIIPVLRYSEADLKYISAYNNPATMAIRIDPPVTRDHDCLGRIREKIVAFTRYMVP